MPLTARVTRTFMEIIPKPPEIAAAAPKKTNATVPLNKFSQVAERPTPHLRYIMTENDHVKAAPRLAAQPIAELDII
jgi:hypothetical protein